MSMAEASLFITAVLLLLSLFRFFEAFSSKKELKEFRESTALDLTGHRANSEKDLLAINVKLDVVVSAAVKSAERIAVIDQWRIDHQSEDQRAHLEHERFRDEHRGVLPDIAALKAVAERRRRGKRIAKRLK